MKIEFYSAGKQIPTELRLKVDDKFDVYYSPNCGAKMESGG